jgi:SAM-dependent methyltransferase
MPYPVEDTYVRGTASPSRDSSIFDCPPSVDINAARMKHLDSLGLPLRGTSVLDAGCGVGHLASYFLKIGCDVTCVDGRQENIDRLRQLYPAARVGVFDVQTDSLKPLGSFDVVFSYGLLYHLESPVAALRNMASVCEQILLLETQICDHVLPVLRIEAEPASADQALRGLGGRPSPSFIVTVLRNIGFRNVYAPRTPPAHADFQFHWRGMGATGAGGRSFRCVFIASRDPLANEKLVALI